MKIFCLLASLSIAQAMVGPSWTYDNSVEKPAGEKQIGSYVLGVYTKEQQERLGLDEFGNPLTVDLYDYSVSAEQRFSQWKRDMQKVNKRSLFLATLDFIKKISEDFLSPHD